MEEEHTGLELEAITTRLKSEFAPPSTALPLRKPRRDRGLRLFIVRTPFDVTSTDFGGAFDRCTDPWVGAAAADVAGERLIDVAVGGFGNFRQQRGGRHDLP